MRAVLTFYSMLMAVYPLAGQDLAAKSKQASQALAQGRFQEAGRIYTELVTALPGNAGLRLNLGLALFSMGEYARASVELSEATRRQPDLQPAWMLLGLAYQKQDAPKLAVEPLRRALELKPADGLARLELADAYLRTADPARAAEEFRRLAEDEPLNSKAWQGLGLAYLTLAENAAKRLERVTGGDPWRDAYLADLRLEQRRWAEAYALYRRALAGVAIPGVHANITRIYRETGHADWAEIETARAPVAANPDWGEVLRRYEGQAASQALYWMVRAASALSESAQAKLRELPESGAVHELAAQWHEWKGRRADAVIEWRAALRFAPGDLRVSGALARALWRNREYEEARPLLAALIERQPHAAEWQYLMGDLLYRVGQSEQAAPYLEAALRREPGQVAAHATLGRVYMQLEQPAKAIPHLQAALDADEDGSLHYELGVAYRRTGQAERAKAMFERQRALQSGTEPPEPEIKGPVN